MRDLSYSGGAPWWLPLALAACAQGGPSGPGTCPFAGSAGTVTVSYDGSPFVTPSCWEVAAGGTDTPAAVIESDNFDFASATLRLTIVFYANRGDDPTQPACPWQTGMVVPLTSDCLSLTASGGGVFTATAGYAATDGTVVPTGSLTLYAWPDAGSSLSVSFSSDATLLFDPALNSGSSGDAGLLPVSGAARAISLGDVSPGDGTGD